MRRQPLSQEDTESIHDLLPTLSDDEGATDLKLDFEKITVIIPPSQKPETQPDCPCPRCGHPLLNQIGLGLCEHCGYCRSLDEMNKAMAGKETWVAPQPKRGGVPEWFSVLACGVLICVLSSFMAGLNLSAGDPQVRWRWCWVQGGLGVACMVIAHVWAFVMLTRAGRRWRQLHWFVSPQLWWAAWWRLPETRWPIWLSSWGVVIVACAFLVACGVEHRVLTQIMALRGR